MNARKWCLLLFSGIVILIIMCMSIVIYVDPYMHYHEPLCVMDYSASKVYLNDGMTRNCKYEAIITGTSTVGGFDVDDAEQIWGKEFICASFPGESFKRVSDNLQVGFNNNQALDMVIWGVDTLWFVAEADYLAYENYPEYLYDNNLWNDVNYLLNGDVLVEEIWKPFHIGQAKSNDNAIGKGYDDNKFFLDDADNENVEILALTNYERPLKENHLVSSTETEEMLEKLDQNIQRNVISRIEENQNVTFYIFFPPYSILWWDSLHQLGEEVINRRVLMEQYVIEELLEYENVHLYSFANCYNLTCNLKNYIDDVHYKDEICTWILNCIKDGKYELKKDNYKEYIADILYFYNNYDYDIIFKV